MSGNGETMAKPLPLSPEYRANVRAALRAKPLPVHRREGNPYHAFALDEDIARDLEAVYGHAFRKARIAGLIED